MFQELGADARAFLGVIAFFPQFDRRSETPIVFGLQHTHPTCLPFLTQSIHTPPAVMSNSGKQCDGERVKGELT